MASIYLISAEDQPGATRRVHPAGGYKPCRKQGLHRAFQSPDGMAVCPGCDRTCVLPDGFKRGDAFLTVPRPKE
jgi:hypothetical protein